MKIHSRFDPPEAFPFEFTEPSMTQQHFKEDCDINNIIARFTKTGLLPQIDAQFEYADVSDHQTFEESMNLVARTKEAFMELPAYLRKRFDNDPAAMLAFIDDPANTDEAVKLGLIEMSEEIPPSSLETPGETVGGKAADVDTPAEPSA